MRRYLFILLMLCPLAVSASNDFSLYDLTCDNAVNPLGLENQHPCFSWKIHADGRNFVQSAYQILVSTRTDDLDKDCGSVWNSQKVSSSQSILIPFEGKQLLSSTVYYWKVRIWDKDNRASSWSQVQSFATGLPSPGDWRNARWIALEKDKADGYLVPGLHVFTNLKESIGNKKFGLYPLPQFRKSISLTKKVKRADAYVAGLGHFDFFLNGEKVGDHFLDAGWTKYDKEALYVAFDVTKLLKDGKNVIGVMLGNGFYNVPNERYFKLVTSYGAPKMKLLLKIEYTDGSTQYVVSDRSWKVTQSAIVYSSIYGGEDYDATREIADWQTEGFNDRSWKNAIEVNNPVKMNAQQSTPLTIRNDMPIVAKFKNKKGLWVYDLGQNFSGIIRVKIHSKDSRTVVFRPAELLNPDSTVNQSASGAPFYFSYRTKAGDYEAVWQPQFTYYGFRYVQLEGAVPADVAQSQQLPEIVSLVGVHTCNAAPEAGSFVCSKPMFNQIHNLIDWAIRSNMASVLTDCPHREKLGWQEQTYLMQNSLLYRYNLSRLYRKIFKDLQTSQREDGCIPSIDPEYVRFESGFEDSPEWGSSFIISPWNQYRWYGDRASLESCYPDMKKYIDYLGSKAQNNILSYGLGDWFDIGPKSPGYAQLTSYGVTATATYYYDVTIMRQVASLLKKDNDVAYYEQLGRNIKKAFEDKYIDKTTKKVERDSQTANAMALYTGLVEPADTAWVMHNLIESIRSKNNALTAGDIGYSYLLKTLGEHGRADIIYDMNSKYDVPGYGWQLAHGATALTESWQAYGFISNNHFMLGHLMEWFYSGLGGIRQSTSSVAYHDILIDPQITGDITSASASYECPYGTIRSEWKLSGNEYMLHVSIPANTFASVILPCSDPNMITEYGSLLSSNKDLPTSPADSNKLCVRLGSGDYRFVVDRGRNIK
jgi:alpha-L-rhamnosidase